MEKNVKQFNLFRLNANLLVKYMHTHKHSPKSKQSICCGEPIMLTADQRVNLCVCVCVISVSFYAMFLFNFYFQLIEHKHFRSIQFPSLEWEHSEFAVVNGGSSSA